MKYFASEQEWDEFIDCHPDAHLLQTTEWGKFKTFFGWEVLRFIHQDCGAQVLFKKLPLGFTMAYLPKGPVGNNWKQLLDEIVLVCKQKRAVALIVEPDYWEEEDTLIRTNLPKPFIAQEHTIQPRRTLIVNLSRDETEILAAMKQKTRYNINLAVRKGVEIKQIDDIQTFYKMMQITGKRDGFGIHTQAYYQKVFEIFSQKGMGVLMGATFEKRILAVLMAFCNKKTAWYFYGASNDEERNRMPTYLLQWEAMRWAKEKGCLDYDLWGVPDQDEETLEGNFTLRSEGLWGVYRFKRGFGGVLKRSVPAYVNIFNPLIYRIYQQHSGQRVG